MGLALIAHFRPTIFVYKDNLPLGHLTRRTVVLSSILRLDLSLGRYLTLVPKPDKRCLQNPA